MSEPAARIVCDRRRPRVVYDGCRHAIDGRNGQAWPAWYRGPQRTEHRPGPCPWCAKLAGWRTP